jgi:hypothetical protein
VDQGRYGASQVNYVTKSGSNEFHGNLYELWNEARLNAADYFTNATPGNHKPGATVNHFGGSLGGPIVHDKLFFFFDSEWVRIALPIVTPTTVPSAAFQQYVLQQLPLGGTDSVTGSNYAPAPQLVPLYQKMFSLYGNTGGTSLAVLGCPLNAAALRHWAGIATYVLAAAIAPSPITAVAIATVPSVSAGLAITGSQLVRMSFCPWPMSTWSSPYLTNSRTWRYRTSRSSMTSCSAPVRKPYKR